MKNRILKIMAISLIGVFSGTDSFAKDIYAFVISRELRQMDTVIAGFSENFPDARPLILDLKDSRDSETVAEFIKSEKPSVLICLGILAANAVIQAEKKIPVIFAMVINYQRYPELRQKNVTGISMEIPPATLFVQFRMLMPEIKAIGVPYNPEVSSEIFNDALAVSSKMDIQVIPCSVTNPSDLKEVLMKNEKKISGLWMLADTKLYNRETDAFEVLTSFSASRKIPILAFSEAFLNKGAFFSVSIDYRSLGSQIALISRQLVQDKADPSEIPVSPPLGTFTVINKNVAKLFAGDKFDESMFDLADKVFPSEK